MYILIDHYIIQIFLIHLTISSIMQNRSVGASLLTTDQPNSSSQHVRVEDPRKLHKTGHALRKGVQIIRGNHVIHEDLFYRFLSTEPLLPFALTIILFLGHQELFDQHI